VLGTRFIKSKRNPDHLCHVAQSQQLRTLRALYVLNHCGYGISGERGLEHRYETWNYTWEDSSNAGDSEGLNLPDVIMTSSPTKEEWKSKIWSSRTSTHMCFATLSATAAVVHCVPKGLLIPPPLHCPVSTMAWYIVLRSQPSDTGSDDYLQDTHTKYTLYVGNIRCHDTRLAMWNYNGMEGFSVFDPFSSPSHILVIPVNLNSFCFCQHCSMCNLEIDSAHEVSRKCASGEGGCHPKGDCTWWPLCLAVERPWSVLDGPEGASKVLLIL